MVTNPKSAKTHNIHLSFNNVGLVGQYYGLYTWVYQVEPMLVYNHFKQGDYINLYWDPDVSLVTSSFLIGFFQEIAKEIGYDGIVKCIKIYSPINIISKDSNTLTIQDVH